jgi:hypothetical protein
MLLVVLESETGSGLYFSRFSSTTGQPIWTKDLDGAYLYSKSSISPTLDTVKQVLSNNWNYVDLVEWEMGLK